MGVVTVAERDFFISYARHDVRWARWIAAELEEAGYTTTLQDLDFRAGADFMQKMQDATSASKRTIAVLSPAYLASAFAGLEWRAVLVGDPSGEKGSLIPVRVQDCTPTGLLATRVYVDLVGLDAAEARAKLLEAVAPSRRPTHTLFPAHADDGRLANDDDPLPVRAGMVTEVPVTGAVSQTGGPQRRFRVEGWTRLRRWAAIAVVATLAAFLLVALTTDDAVEATGDIALLREGGAPRLVFPMASGGIAYCARPNDDDWSEPWSSEVSDDDWPGIEDYAVFHSGFDGFEVLGHKDGILTFGYRDNGYPSGVRRWHDPVPVLDDLTDEPVQGVVGRPGFFQYRLPGVGEPQFLAVVPVSSGGLDIYVRNGTGQRWHKQGNVAASAGRIDAVSLAYSPTKGVVAVLRVGPQLYQMARSPVGIPSEIATGWSEPRLLSVVGGRAEATDDPALTRSNADGDAEDDSFWLAVPVRDGLALLGARDGVSGEWSLEVVPGVPRPDSVAVMEGSQDGRPNLEIAYRSGTTLSSTWRVDGQPWQEPTEVRC